MVNSNREVSRNLQSERRPPTDTLDLAVCGSTNERAAGLFLNQNRGQQADGSADHFAVREVMPITKLTSGVR